jgi:8-oxo-dGTP pyrophosphatase MutT (NUDIX family)
LPGGSLEYGEHPEEAVLREVWEETGLNVDVGRLLLINTWRPDRVGMYYLCKVTGGEFRPNEEVSEFAYFSLDNLPDIRPVDFDMIRNLHRMAEHELA